MEMKNEGNEERSKGGPWDIMRKTMKMRNESIMVVGTLRVIMRDKSVMVSKYIWEHIWCQKIFVKFIYESIM